MGTLEITLDLDDVMWTRVLRGVVAGTVLIPVLAFLFA